MRPVDCSSYLYRPSSRLAFTSHRSAAGSRGTRGGGGADGVVVLDDVVIGWLVGVAPLATEGDVLTAASDGCVGAAAELRVLAADDAGDERRLKGHRHRH